LLLEDRAIKSRSVVDGGGNETLRILVGRQPEMGLHFDRSLIAYLIFLSLGGKEPALLSFTSWVGSRSFESEV
jgi:hypothetical protein